MFPLKLRSLSLPAAIGDRRMSPRLLIWILQTLVVALSGFSAYLLRFEFRLEPRHWDQIAVAIPVWVLSKSVVFRLMKLDRGWWSHCSTPDIARLGLANLGGSVLALVLFGFGSVGIPRSVYVMDLVLCLQATAGLRLFSRLLKETTFALRRSVRGCRRVLIYGAGEAGVALLREIRNNARLACEVRGFVDDSPLKRGMRMQLMPVLGCGADLSRIALAEQVEEVLIAIPSADGAAMTRILRHCHDAGVACKTIPGLGDLIEGNTLAAQIREVAVEDLLARKPVHLETDAIRGKLEGQIVLVTGAAGSIGAELCRQIARFRPALIVAYEIGETPLFQLEQQMKAALPQQRFRYEIGSIQNARRLDEVFGALRPSVVFHAAAYKHVPLMESHLFEAVENNILGTYNVALAAARHEARDFVMISSDKAVRPTNIMGLTKRVAELLVNSLETGGTKFACVRFGNVLGSNGSVVPIFKAQIANGGPVTITDPEMRRFFMTIPEAAQLVLQASAMSQGGEIFVLDMGEPVRIVDLATNLILLSGLRPGKDIKLEFTGVRPGEKLYEELTAYHENTVPTCHEKIKIFSSGAGLREGMIDRIRMLRDLCELRDAGALLLKLKELVPEYNPSTQILESLLLAPEPAPRVPQRPVAIQHPPAAVGSNLAPDRRSLWMPHRL